MKYNNKKIAVISIAALLGIGVISTSFALFTKVDEKITIDITGQTGKDGVFQLTEKQALTSSKINPLSPSTKFSYYLNMTPGANYTQASVLGNVKVAVSVTGLTEEKNAEFLSKLTITPTIGGYLAGTYYAANTPTLTAVSGTPGTFAGNVPIQINAAGTEADPKQYVDVEIKYNGGLDEYLTNYDGASISYSVTLGDAVSYNRLYIRGSFDANNWQAMDTYSFVPNLKKKETSYLELMYQDLELKENDEFKFYCSSWSDNDGWATHIKKDGTGSNNLTLANNNWKVNIGKTGKYSFYFKTTGDNQGFIVDYTAPSVS